MTYITKSLLVLILTVFSFLSTVSADESSSLDFATSLEGLTASKLKVRAKAIDTLIMSKDDRLVSVINALLESKLYYRKADKVIAFISSQDGVKYATTVLTSEAVGEISSRKWKKIIINNGIRTKLRNTLSMVELNNPSPQVRMKAIEQVLNQLDVNQVKALETRLSSEKDEEVKSRLELTVAILKLSDRKGDSLALIEEVKTSVHPSVRQVLASVIADANTEPKVQRSAKAALKKIESRVDNYDKLEILFFGLSLGSVLVLAAIGLAITFGVMGVINMAHGELIMLGAYTTYVVQLMFPNWIEYSVLIAIPLAFVVAGTVGILIERGIIRHLYGRPLETLLATFGV